MEFKVGDRARCIKTRGWEGKSWVDGEPFIVRKNDLKIINEEYNDNFVKEGTASLRERIHQLEGWTKEADDILFKIKNGKKPFNTEIVINDDATSGYGHIIISSISGRFGEEVFHYRNQCGKLLAFKNALLWLLDKSGLEGHKKGDTIKIESEGKIYKVKILEEE